jgi:hypothetical protein
VSDRESLPLFNAADAGGPSEDEIRTALFAARLRLPIDRAMAVPALAICVRNLAYALRRARGDASGRRARAGCAATPVRGG